MSVNPEATTGVGEEVPTADTVAVRELLDDLAAADLLSLQLAISALRNAYLETHQGHPEWLRYAHSLTRLKAFAEHALASTGYDENTINRARNHQDVGQARHDADEPRTNT